MKITTLLIITALIAIPIQRALPDEKPPEPANQQEWLLAMCVVAAAGAAAAGVYLVSRSCKPKYYWLMDSDQPPTFWIGTATRKECEINGWKRIGGPYDKPADAPTQHPSPTNRVDTVAGPILNIKVQASTNLTDWTTVHQASADLEDFVYWPTNAAMYRLEVGQ